MSKAHIIPQHAPMMWGAKKKGQIVKATYPNQNLMYLGSGRFTVAFKQTNSSIVWLYTYWEDFSKSIMAHAHREYVESTFLAIPHIIRQRSWDYKGKRCNVYKSEYIDPYESSRARSKHLQKLVDNLMEVHEEVRNKYKGDITDERNQQCDAFNRDIILGCMDADIPEYLTDTLELLQWVAQDWGDHYIFDNFHERNLGVKNNKLMLLDPMFDMNKIQKDFNARKKRDTTAARLIHEIDNYMS
jgi:hypothetical protein